MSKDPEKTPTPSPTRMCGGIIREEIPSENKATRKSDPINITNIREFITLIDNHSGHLRNDDCYWYIEQLEKVPGGLAHIYSIYPGGQEGFLAAVKAIGKEGWLEVKKLLVPAVDGKGYANPSKHPRGMKSFIF